MEGEATFPPPVWLMRQAGRYLPEYLAIRAKASSFLNFCYTPVLAAEATLQPIRRFGFDAAILFSDILVVPDALGQKVSFEQGEGPKLDPIVAPEDFAKLTETLDFSRLAPIFETIERVKQDLPKETALIGFCGAPWTLACYMIAGKSTPDQAPARLFAYRYPDQFQHLIDRLVDVSIDYLAKQIEAGVEAVQIFDTWAGVLPAAEFERWCTAPVAAIVTGLRRRHKGARVIGFPKGAALHLKDYAVRTGINVLGLDSTIDPEWAGRTLERNLVLQGNLDPLALAAGGAALERGVGDIFSALRGRPHIFNLGHGILPQTPVDHVTLMLERVRRSAAQ
ncbi:uroporphyrinogen decarboxylase [Methylocapsa sp. D3K7]|uniref:uroporphyrinogen decarboxylase n=1 Tax=Methylocapsa sp. D3K7 TaxID=3041435 RepID=UPI00244EC0F0|nr:uroporphyrinogen decarboxylase [Methylocapsa sp. D3K7]WGJ16548.1 uroporphyrinogen decarboxylase [Methylocapsa sp. D3K7]